MLGTVLNYNRSKSYGFILPDDASLPDCFVSWKWIVADKHRLYLIPNQRVEFDFVEQDGKPQARNVRVIGITIARQVSAQVADSERPRR